MIRYLHIVVDNTLPRTLVGDLGAFWRSNYPDWTIRHENEVAKASSKDSHWIGKLRQIEKTGAWLIITSDKGMGDRKETEKLPYLCKKHDHGYIILSRSVGRVEHFKAAIASVWPEFPVAIKVCQHLKHRPSTHVKLGQFSSKKVEVGYKLQVLGSSLLKYLKDHENDPK